jgi:hypothetical protein
MQPKTVKNKNNDIFENGRQPQFFLSGRRPPKKLKIKSKNNGCGTAPGNLVCFNISYRYRLFSQLLYQTNTDYAKNKD